ncbi:VOC family protein [Streptomyces sp. NPDC003299]
MRTLFVSYRVTDQERSLRFYTALGYGGLGRVEASDGSRLVILKFPEETTASLEQVHRPADEPLDVGSGVDHLAVQVDGLAGTLEGRRSAATGATGVDPAPRAVVDGRARRGSPFVPGTVYRRATATGAGQAAAPPSSPSATTTPTPPTAHQ